METRAHGGANGNPALNVRFGPFELNLREGELRKEGRRIRLQEQPFQMLRMLLETPGAVVVREEIRKRLWPDDTVVECDHSINAAVKRLRDALRDSADKPRYLETAAQRGYRFIGSVDAATDNPSLAEPIAVIPNNNDLRNGHAEQAPRRPTLHRRLWIFGVVLATIILMVWAGAEYGRRTVRTVAASLQPLMRLDLDLGDEMPRSSQAGDSAILSPDGRRLVYISRSKLFTRWLDQSNAVELSGTENAKAPFFSPDGQSVALFAAGRLKKVPVWGGRVTELCEASRGAAGGGSWGEDGYIVAACDDGL